MNKGHLIFAQNSDVDYVRQAYALALTIKRHNKINQTCLVTNDTVPEHYKKVFDYIIEIPWGDEAKDSIWKVQNRWKIIYSSPFDETLVYDSDMLLFSSNDYWWDLMQGKDLVLTKTVYNYRGSVVKNSKLRKCFTENDLPDLYFGIHYFKKTKRAYEFYAWLDAMSKHYDEIYAEFAPKATQSFYSLDVSSAIITKLMDAETEFTLDVPVPTFVHMKKEVQGWKDYTLSWQNSVIENFNSKGELKISNFLQTGVFHYTESKFLTDKIIEILEDNYADVVRLL
jgi:hypothetical protein